MMLKKFKKPVLREPTKLEFEGITRIMNGQGWVLNENKTLFQNLKQPEIVIEKDKIVVPQFFNPVSEMATKTIKETGLLKLMEHQMNNDDTVFYDKNKDEEL